MNTQKHWHVPPLKETKTLKIVQIWYKFEWNCVTWWCEPINRNSEFSVFLAVIVWRKIKLKRG